MSEHQRRSKQQAEQGSAPRPQEKSPRAPRSEVPRRLASTGLAGLPRAIWQAGNAAIGRLLGRQSGGQHLDPQTRTEMEQVFGADFRDVHLHDDPAAQATSGALGAQAVTHGDDVYLGTDAPATESAAGKKLLAHELAHVVQQRHAGGVDANRVSQPGDSFEQAADHAAAAASAGQAAQVAGAGVPPAVQRQEDPRKRTKRPPAKPLPPPIAGPLEKGVAIGSEGVSVGGVPLNKIPEIFQGKKIDDSTDKKKRPKPKEDTLPRKPPESKTSEPGLIIPPPESKEAWPPLGPSPTEWKPPESMLEAGLRFGTTMPSVIDGFRVGSAALGPHQHEQLDRLAGLITSNPNPDIEVEIEIIGHADTTGEESRNQNLSQQRARAVRDHLVKECGVDEFKIRSVTGRGEKELSVPERTAEDRARNRRVEIIIRTTAVRRSERPFDRRLPR